MHILKLQVWLLNKSLLRIFRRSYKKLQLRTKEYWLKNLVTLRNVLEPLYFFGIFRIVKTLVIFRISLQNCESIKN